MSDEKATSKPASKPADSKASAGAGEVQKTMDAEQEKGFRGTMVDPTPNSAYTVAGVTAGEPTPETDEGAAKAAADRAESLRNVEAGKPVKE